MCHFYLVSYLGKWQAGALSVRDTWKMEFSLEVCKYSTLWVYHDHVLREKTLTSNDSASCRGVTLTLRSLEQAGPLYFQNGKQNSSLP